MEIILIVAAGQKNEIGLNNQLLWNLPRDMQYFREITQGSVVISGRKNYESIPEKYRPLPGRINFVVTHNKDFKADGAYVFNDLITAIETAKTKNVSACFIIGGGTIYKQALENNLVDKVLLTRIDNAFKADTFLEGFNKENWYLKSEYSFLADNKNAYNMRFQTWIKP